MISVSWWFGGLVRWTRLMGFFFFNDTATTEIYTLSLHDALPICHPEREFVERLILEAAAPQVQGRRVARPRSDLRDASVREAPASEQRAAVTAGALGLAEEQQRATLLRRRQGRVVAVQVAIERRVGLGEGLHLEGGDRRGSMLEPELRGRRTREGSGELRLVGIERQQPPHDRLPDLHELAVAVLRQLVRVSEHVEVAALATHLAAVRHGEHRLGCEDVGHCRQQRARRRHERLPSRAPRGGGRGGGPRGGGGPRRAPGRLPRGGGGGGGGAPRAPRGGQKRGKTARPRR